MASDAPAQGVEPKADVIREAALELFWKYGYHGTSVRQIGKAAGIAVANVYHYFPSKLDLLYDIVGRVTDSLGAKTEEATAMADADAVSQFKAVLNAHVRCHMEYQRESFLGNAELRSFPEPLRGLYVAKRDAQEARFRRAVDLGIEQKVFDVPYPHETVLALITMCTAISQWYRPDGELSEDEIVERYTALALKMVGA